MSAYSLDEIMLLGSESGWRPPFHGKKAHQLASPFGPLDINIWPIYKVDFVGVQFIYDKRGGAPYVLGIYAGGEEAKITVTDSCQEYRPVYQWDGAVGGFKQVDLLQRDTVLKFYYTEVEAPCKK
jgi:hypothetical protein